jgi:hypothetical protein
MATRCIVLDADFACGDEEVLFSTTEGVKTFLFFVETLPCFFFFRDESK